MTKPFVKTMNHYKFDCAICRKASSGWPNNPYPIIKDKDAECCNDCNANVVIPARIFGMTEARNKN